MKPTLDNKQYDDFAILMTLTSTFVGRPQSSQLRSKWVGIEWSGIWSRRWPPDQTDVLRVCRLDSIRVRRRMTIIQLRMLSALRFDDKGRIRPWTNSTVGKRIKWAFYWKWRNRIKRWKSFSNTHKKKLSFFPTQIAHGHFTYKSIFLPQREMQPFLSLLTFLWRKHIKRTTWAWNDIKR